jgi:hypothetical protein
MNRSASYEVGERENRLTTFAFSTGSLPGFCEDLQVRHEAKLLLVGPFVPARARVALAVNVIPLSDAVVDVPNLADQRLAADVTHVSSGLGDIISGYALPIPTRNPWKLDHIRWPPTA